MKINPINNFKILKIKQRKNNQINFNGLNETLKPVSDNPFLKMQIEMQAKRLQKSSNKNKQLASDITAQAQLIKHASKMVLSDSKTILNTAQKIKKQGILSQITPKDGKIYAFIGNSKEKTRDVFIFDAVSKELESYCANAKITDDTLTADRRFVFKSGKLDTYDEYFLSVEELDSKYEKSFYGFIFENNELAEYSKDREAWQGFRMNLGEAFAFKNDKIHYYCKDLTYEYESGYDFSKIQIDFDENEQMKEFIVAETQEPTGDKTFKKRFMYQNGVLRKIQINPEEIKGYSTESDKTFIFQNGKLKACNFGEIQKGLDVTCSKRLEF